MLADPDQKYDEKERGHMGRWRSDDGSPDFAASRPRLRMAAAAAVTDAWLWLATISSALPFATARSTRSTHLHAHIEASACI